MNNDPGMKAYPMTGSAYPMGKAYPMNAASPPTLPYGGLPSPTSNPTPGTSAAPVPPMVSPSAMAMMGAPPAGAVPQIPAPQQPPRQPGYPSGDRMHMPIGKNGFGLHPDVTPNEIVEYLIPKVKSVESSNDPVNYIGKVNHQPYNSRRSASGHFGYTASTWGNYKGYPRAMDAPPEIQEEKFRKDMGDAVLKFGGDPFKAVAHHFYPEHAPDPTKWDTPTAPGSGTVNQYLSKIFNAGSEKAGDRHAKYIQGVNPNRQSNNNQAALQLP
jgi:hypothetical protein